jgi:hypothetical protein
MSSYMNLKQTVTYKTTLHGFWSASELTVEQPPLVGEF